MSTTDNTTRYLEDLLNAVDENLANLEQDEKYVLEKLATEAHWNTIPIGLRKRLGQLFRALAKDGQLQVVCAGKTSGNSRRYEKR